MSLFTENKFRTAIEVLQKGRDALVEDLANELIHQGDDLIDGGYQFNELLESQGTRLHFLGLLISQLEVSAEAHEEAIAAQQLPPKPEVPKKKARSRPKKIQEKVRPEGTPEDF